MAASDTKQDIDEMFARMGQKLGWFKNGDRSSDKTMLTNNSKTTTPIKIKEEKPDGKSTDGKKRNRLKLKKKSVKAGSESKEKKNSSKSKFSISKPPSFQGLLSSDSEDEPKVLEINPKSSNQPNAVLCSDSDDDFVEPNRNGNKVNKNGTGSTISCVGESFLSSDHHSGKSWGKPQSLCDYNDTIVQKRVSIASCTLNIDDLGEPLVESTRIHRRSSITYRQIIEAIQESDNESIGSDNDKTNQNGPEADVSDIVCDDTRYVTAIENLEGLKIGPDSPVKTDTETSERYADKSDSTNEITRENEVGQEPDKVDNGNSGSQRNSPSRDKSYEEVEVVDCWTQTDDVVSVDCGLNTMTGEVPDVTIANDSETLNVYQEETVANGISFDDEDPEVNDLYKEKTVDDAVNSQHNESNTYTENTEVVSDVNNYSGMTENSIKESEKDSDSIYNEGTQSYNDLHIFADVTTAGTTDDKQREDYEGNTVYSMDCSDNKPTETFENENENNTDIENTPELDTSEIEVVDVGTQTEEIVKSVKETEDNDNVTSINEPEQDNIYTVEDNNEINDGDSEQSDQSVEEKGEILDDKAGESDSNENDASDNEASLETEQNDKDIETDVPLDNGLNSSNDDSFDEITQSKKVQRCRKTKKERNESKKCSDGGSHKDAEQSWRSRKYSDSSDSDNLESFFQKLRGKPKPIESESDSEPPSPVSMDDFIVEDDDMSSESDDNVFYLRETQKMNESPEYVPSCSSSDATDSGSCSDLDDDDSRSESDESRKKVSSKKDKKLLPSFSSGEDEPDSSHSSISTSNTKKSNKNEKSLPPGDKKVKKKSNKLQTSRIDFGLSSDSDSELLDLPEIVVKPSPKVTDKKTSKSREDSIPSIGDSELFKTPNPIRRKALASDKENRFKTPTSVKKSSVSSKGYISISEDSDSDSSDFIVTPSPSVKSISGTQKTVGRTPKTKISGTSKTNTSSTSSLMDRILTPRDIGGNKRADSLSTPLRESPTCSFLKSLSCSMDDDRRHPEAKKFVKGFKKCKEELSTYLFELFNKTVFDNKLPKDMSLTWNKRLLRTAGYCAYKKNVKNPEDRTARIELSTKVCDSAERTRDTLIHEMCHAAVWLLNGVNGGHGPYWKYWARHATRVHLELPSISRCHSYSINTKFTYRCKKCGYSIGRHSKSLDTKKKVCGYCRGEFELIQNSEPTTPSSASSSVSTTPRQPNKFALFVKENYNSVKKRKQDLKHGDVMKELSKMFAESKITS